MVQNKKPHSAYRQIIAFPIKISYKVVCQPFLVNPFSKLAITHAYPKPTTKDNISNEAILTRPNDDLLKSLEGKVPEIYQIGDCKEPAFMPEAIADGSRIARVI